VSTQRAMSDQDKNEATATTEDTKPAEGHDAGSKEDKEKEKEFQFDEDPVFDIEYKGDCAYEVKVSIGAVNEKKQAAELFKELQAEAELPGFRKGRAPRKLLEKKFGKAVRSDATEKLLSAAFKKLIKDKDLKPIRFPDVDGLEKTLERGADDPITCTFKFEVAPRCELGPYRGIEVEKPVLRVEDADIEKALVDLRNRFALFENLEGGSAEVGDQVIIDFKGMIDGEAFPGSSADNYPYILGSKRFFPEFEAALIGAKAGAEVACEVDFPSDYSNANLAGKTADFRITVKEIKRKQLPDLDDNFAKQAGAESAAALREKVAQDLRNNAADQSNRIAEHNALVKIVEASTFDLPKSLVKASADEYFEEETRRLTALRVSQSEINARAEELRKAAEEAALREIKAYVAVNEIGQAEGIEVTEDDFEKEAEAIMSRTGITADVISRYLRQEDKRDEYEDRIFRKKALAVVMDNAKIVEKEVPREELEKEDDTVES